MKIQINESQSIKLFEKILNREMPKNFPWWVKIDLTEIRRMTMRPKLMWVEGVLEVDSEWAHNQWVELKYAKEPFFGDTGYSTLLPEIVSNFLADEIRSEMSTVLTFATGEDAYVPTLSHIEVKPKETEINESLESKWNKGNYNYQHGFCHYFAYNIIDKIKERFPNKEVNYYLLLANEVDTEYDNDVVQEYLIHAYIQIDDILLDSNGFTTHDVAWERAEEWERVQRRMTPEEYEINVWDEETDEIPEWFFNNSFCNTGRVKKDLEDFLNNPIVKRILRDK
jgi:hypothetical protein